MSTDLMKSHFHLPSQNKSLQDVLLLSLLIGTQKSLGSELSLRIPHEGPTDRNQWQCSAVSIRRKYGYTALKYRSTDQGTRKGGHSRPCSCKALPLSLAFYSLP